MKCRVYTAEGKNFGSLTGEILRNCEPDGNIVRLVFFGCPRDNGDYLRQRQEIGRQVRSYFGTRCPAYSYIAQKPLTADLALEVHSADSSFEGSILYGECGDVPYVVLRGKNYRELIAGGMGGRDVNAPVRVQAEEAMERVKMLLTKEGFTVDGIVRQWNYLERITDFDGECQRYQEFNEARSGFYASASWPDGYPAATGIGTQGGGIVIDFVAVKAEAEGCRCVSLNNALQIAAHAYTRRVLQGKLSAEQGKITPKFERARVFDMGNERMIYVSGTAAIRGERSLTEGGVLSQMEITMENVRYLISGENLQKKGITGEGELAMLRVYLKHPDDLEAVKMYVGEHLEELPVIYLLADVCREELLVEVEGVAQIY